MQEYKVAGIRVFTADWMKPDEIVVVPDRRTLESDDEYWNRVRSQAVIVRGIEIPK